MLSERRLKFSVTTFAVDVSVHWFWNESRRIFWLLQVFMFLFRNKKYAESQMCVRCVYSPGVQHGCVRALALLQFILLWTCGCVFCFIPSSMFSHLLRALIHICLPFGQLLNKFSYQRCHFHGSTCISLSYTQCKHAHILISCACVAGNCVDLWVIKCAYTKHNVVSAHVHPNKHSRMQICAQGMCSFFEKKNSMDVCCQVACVGSLPTGWLVGKVFSWLACWWADLLIGWSFGRPIDLVVNLLVDL